MSSPDVSADKSPEGRWWSVRAGEYVLGTLRGEDLALFERILVHDTAVQDEVARWERRLAPLDEGTRERVPGEHVWPQVLARIRAAGETEATAAPPSRTAPPRPTPARPSPSPWRSPFWPVLAGLATAASVVLGVLLYQRTLGPAFAPLSVDGLAVVLADEGGEPYFLVETDYGNLRVRVTALSPPDLDGERDFQLWQALPDRSAVRPVALLPEEAGTSRVFEVDSLIDGSDLFGVSIEPIGAPTDAGPTGPVVAHGDFLPTREVD